MEWIGSDCPGGGGGAQTRKGLGVSLDFKMGAKYENYGFIYSLLGRLQ